MTTPVAIRALHQHEPSAWMQAVVADMLRAQREGRVERCCEQALIWPVWAPSRMACPAHEAFIAGDRNSELRCDRCAIVVGSSADLHLITRLDVDSLTFIVTGLCPTCGRLEDGSAS
jgi:hypothetical protein